MRAQIIRLLRETPGQFVTGETLINTCQISRQGVWKHIQALVEEGYEITSAKGSGYTLTSEPSELTQTALELIVGETQLIERAYHFDTLPSTNAFLKENAKKVTSALAVADTQTAGRGRLGRQWESAPLEGLWFSMLQRPTILPSQASMLTQVVAAAMVKALTELTNLPISIKWPNDLMIGHKKLCGILTEMSAELTAIEYVVIGIGLNLSQTAFPAPLDQTATSLICHFQQPLSRQTILQHFLNHYQDDYNQFIHLGNLGGVVSYLNEKSYLNGHDIRVMHNETKLVRAKEVNIFGELVVEGPDGSTETLTYGEVSVRRTEQCY